MWIMSRHGFFSCVCASNRAKKGGSIDTETIMVRARLRKHLDALVAAFPEPFGDSPVVESKTNDYRFRILISKKQFTTLMTAIASDCDYGNFKSEFARKWGADATERALHKIWSILYSVQQTTPDSECRFIDTMSTEGDKK